MNKYINNLKFMSDIGKRNFRWYMVKHAEREGISKAARVYNTTRETVREWVKKYE